MPGTTLHSRFLGEYGSGCSAEVAEKPRLETRHLLAVSPRFFAEVAEPCHGVLVLSATMFTSCWDGFRLSWQNFLDPAAVLHELLKYIRCACESGSNGSTKQWTAKTSLSTT